MSRTQTPCGVSFQPDCRLMYYLFLIGFFAIFSTTISKSPVLPLFSQALGASDVVIGIIAALSPLAGILFSFPVGVLSDHLGRKRLLVISGIVFLCAPLCYLYITAPIWLIPVRFFHGTATAILGPVISAVIAERFPANKGAMLGQYASASLIGRTTAPLVGGFVLAAFVMSPGLMEYKMVYLVAFCAAVPVFILTLLYREDRPGRLDVIGGPVFWESLVMFFSNRRLRATALVDMATYFAFGAFETFLPLFLATMRIGTGEMGIIFAVQVFIIALTKPFFGSLADRIDKRVQIIAGILITGCAVAIIPLGQTFAVFLAASSLFGFGMSLSTVATTAYIADVAKKERVGASMGALSSIMDIGQSSGPVVTGMIIMGSGYMAGFFASFILAILAGIFFAVSVRSPGN